MKSRHQLVHLSTLSIDIAFIRCINWEAPIGIVLYLRDAEDDSSCSTAVISKDHPEYANDRNLLETVVERKGDDRIISIASFLFSVFKALLLRYEDT